MTTPFDNIKRMVDQIGYAGISDCSDAEFRNEATHGIEQVRISLERFMKDETRIVTTGNTDGDLTEETILWSDVLSTELSEKERDLAALQAENAALADRVRALLATVMGIGFDAAFALDCGDETVLRSALERIHQLADEATEPGERARKALRGRSDG